MTSLDIAHQRLHNQLITQRTFDKPADVVQWMGAVQAQDFAAAKWAIGLRMNNATDNDIEQAFTNGAILRTHVMRPTWHFVSPSDIRWLLALTAPRVSALLGYYDRQLELDDATFQQSNTALTKALRGGKQLTRTELASTLQQVGIVTENGQRMTQLMMHAELDGIVCSGARRGKQFTYALLDERVPQTRKLDHDEALAELVKRYITSHGPATMQDFSWWSGLTSAEAKAGLEMNASQVFSESVNGQTYWFTESTPLAQDTSPTAYLLPNYDEYTVSYKNRSAVLNIAHTNKLAVRDNVLFNHVIVLDGQVIGTWKRTLTKDTVFIVLSPFTPLNTDEMQVIAAAAEQYSAYLGLSVNVTYQETRLEQMQKSEDS